MWRIKEFHEVQRFDPWVYVLVGALSLGALIMGAVQIGLGQPVGNNPASNPVLALIIVLFGLGLPAMIFLMKLEIWSGFEGVRVKFAPFLNRLIPFDEIGGADAKTYSPIADYGGWGIRGFGKRVAYNAKGNQGVLVTLRSGGTIMLGSQRSSELEQSIRSGISG